MVPSRNTETTRLTGYFCPHTVYNLSKRVLTNAEMKVLVKGVDSAPIQHQINKPELKTDFKKFCRRMQLKQYFRNDATANFSEAPAFRSKSTCSPPKGHPNLENFK